ncbi:UNVERIFIED_CONTAM: hypothetical protein PYX00_004231 [Menopon gallinae]|uniref:DUF7041 domain-containing protein n=1 Tax=Menopon gallinae TaxID=328185 RepID=A0AAW2I3E2_9NEOP
MASRISRGTVGFAVSYLSQFNNCPEKTHWAAAKRVLRYLRGTADLGILYKSDGDGLKGGPISWDARKQRTVALSSMEAEFMALSDAFKEALYLKSPQSDAKPWLYQYIRLPLGSTYIIDNIINSINIEDLIDFLGGSSSSKQEIHIGDHRRGQEEACAGIAVKQTITPGVGPEPHIWFAQLEIKFAVQKITSDTAKFQHCILALDAASLKSVEDIVLN